MLLWKNIIRRQLLIKTHLLFLLFTEPMIKILKIAHLHEQKHCSTTSNSFSFRDSSIICNFDILMNKLCFFTDVYLIKDGDTGGSFVLTISQNSTIAGLRDKNDLKTINLSSVKNHTKMFMNSIVVSHSQALKSVLIQFLMTAQKQASKRTSFQYSRDYLPSSNEMKLLESNLLVLHEPIFVIHRFKCDNIMHVIHDDLLPLFLTYNRLCMGDIDQCVSHYRLLFLDDCDSSQFFQLYKIFSDHKPLLLHEIKQSDFESNIQSNRIYLFKKIRAGMDTSSIWFDYGFTLQQGGKADSKVDSITLEKFCNFMIRKLKIRNFHPSEKLNILFLNRKINRKIINVLELKENIKLISSEVFRKDITVSESDLYENNVQHLIEQILKADVIIGMHSSSMILTIFRLLKNKTVIFELFPFGIQPKFVSFLYPLREILSHKMKYKFWMNEKENNSLTYPNNPKMYGGLRHLSVAEQKNILETKTIPSVRCCHDPAYLFRMYQDTNVDQSFFKLYHETIENLDACCKERNYSNYWFFPGPVFNINCVFQNFLVLIRWNVPINAFSYKLMYKIAISAGSERPFAFIVHENQLTFNLSHYEIHQKPVELSVWIKSFVPEEVDAESVDVYYSCVEGEQQ